MVDGSATVFGCTYDLSSPDALEQFITDIDSAELVTRWRWAGKWRDKASGAACAPEPTPTANEK